MRSKRNGKFHGPADIWSEDDHEVTDYEVACPRCGHESTYLSTSYDPIRCEACNMRFA